MRADSGLAFNALRFVAFGLITTFDNGSFSPKSPTTENAESRGAIGMKNGDGHGELMIGSADEDTERIEGTLSKTGLAAYVCSGVRGSLIIGLKKISSD